jgi:hypothetical protein
MHSRGDYARLAEPLLRRDPAPALLPTKIYAPALAADIDALAVGTGVKAGLHLLNYDLDRCHDLAQDREGTSTFDYWHAILHRREGDFGNAKYWLTRTGPHPVRIQVYGPDLVQALAFVDQCARVARPSLPPDEKLASSIVNLERTQLHEIALLLEYAEENQQ